MDVFVDPTDRRGLSAQLYAQLRDAIVGGRLVAGDQLTPTRQLAPGRRSNVAVLSG